ncbi:hypothetical protein NEOLEDRAFT_1054584 [Neolentinus lepideus HHB14362 ss-1]|uniref:BAR domain-containing protein n=1 Tax=Neolentinus lepideus HHB14362 ss-1 TaxID=1314782 RepID=A0A165VX01_9AGAM|nr:hypothetical protein NEOLEDRAFT_1054584 [Neolentinus lepideus HHB14362 ss-1]
MDGWNKLQSSFSGLNIGQSANKFAKGFNSSVQATRERLGQIAPDEITELPQEYKDLETRVDALRQAHLALLKITRVYESESYDYPTQIQESLAEITTSLNTSIASLTKGTNLPVPSSPTPVPHQPKTLPHALARASLLGATALGSDGDKLGKGLKEYATAWEKIAEARVQQDQMIRQEFLGPWQTTLSTSIDVAMKARAAVRASRLELDSAKQTLKRASPTKQEQARLEVENAEDDLVQKTEVAITLMKTVLDNPEPIKNLNELCKAQLLYQAAAAEALSTVQGEIEELAVAAEGEYR